MMNKDMILKVGDKITYIEICGTKHTMNIEALAGLSIKYFERDGSKVLKVERPTKYETIYKSKEILDKEEKEYLSAVIKPFRDKVISIEKVDYDFFAQQFILINVSNDATELPCFKKDTMYRGMEVDKEYTLEELGL